ncbi:hypothetical protein BKA63DRAFT_524243 [Paraphoma chrysanthemicola]|nr:hypothetical protein BKA63DRAFT_524243 [Paraphoma chrysanthemicola]
MTSNSYDHLNFGEQDSSTESPPKLLFCNYRTAHGAVNEFQTSRNMEQSISQTMGTGTGLSNSVETTNEARSDVYFPTFEQHRSDASALASDAHFTAMQSLESLQTNSSVGVFDPLTFDPDDMYTDMYNSQFSHAVSDRETLVNVPCAPISAFDDHAAQYSDLQTASWYEDSALQYMTEPQNHSYANSNVPVASGETIQNITSGGAFDDSFEHFTGTSGTDFEAWQPIDMNLSNAEHTGAMDSRRSTFLVADSVASNLGRSPKVVIKKRGPISDTDYSLPKKRRGGRRGALTETQLESFRQAKKRGVCIRCRFVRSKCEGGFPCLYCIQRWSPKLGITPCTKAEFFDIITAGSYFPCNHIKISRSFHSLIPYPDASLYEAAKVQTLDIPSIICQILLMDFLHKRDGTVVVANSKIFSLFQIKLALPWILGHDSINEIYIRHDCAQGRLATIGEVREGLARLAKPRRKRNGLVLSTYLDIKQGSHLFQQLAFCKYGPYSWDMIDVEDLPLENNNTSNVVSEAVQLLIYFTIRHMEFCLFRYLQDVSNDLPKDDVERHHTYIMFLLSILLIVEPFEKGMARNFEIGAENDAIDSVAADHSDRVNRIRIALWIYASVAIGKLSAWTDFWGTALKTHPIMTKQVILEGFANSEREFHVGFEKATKSFLSSAMQLQNMEQTLDDLQCGGCEQNDTVQPEKLPEATKDCEGCEENSTVSLDALQEAMRELFTPGFLKQRLVEYDTSTTGGLFTAETEEKQVDAAAMRFQMLRSIDWTSGFTVKENNILLSLNRELLLCFISMVEGRLMDMHNSRSFQTFLERHSKEHCEGSITLEYLIRRYFESSQKPADKKDEKDFTGKCIKSAVLGKRWIDIADLLGAVEAVLIGGIYDMPSVKAPDPTLNLLAIIEFGTAKQFEGLKSLLRTEMQWLKAICSRLQGILPMILELASLQETDRLRGLALSEQIQGKIFETFGKKTRLEAPEVLQHVEFETTHRIMATISLVIEKSKIAVPMVSGRSDERMVFLEIFVKMIVGSMAEHGSGKAVMTLACTEQLLGEAKRTFLSSYDESIHQHEKGSTEAERAMFRM